MDARHIVIIGSGPAAWSAAIYAARAKLAPLVLAGEQSGGQLMLTTAVENYPGFSGGVLGPTLMADMRAQAEKSGTTVIDKNATAIERDGEMFVVKYGALPANPPNLLVARSVIIATGATAMTLKLPGEDRLMGRGVGVCAVCDAPFYRGASRVFVIGGGDSAVEEAAALAKYANETIILVRKDTMRASAIMQDRIKKHKSIKIWYKSEALELLGDKKLEQVKIIREGKTSVIPANGLFYAIGHAPATGWLTGSGVKLDEKGYVRINLTANWPISNFKSRIPHDRNGEMRFPTATTVAGVFAAGDCVDSYYRQAIVAAGMGAMAALDAQKYLELSE